MEQNFKRTYLDPEDLTPTVDDDSGYRYAILRVEYGFGMMAHPSFVVDDYIGDLPIPSFMNLEAISIHQDVSPLVVLSPRPM